MLNIIDSENISITPMNYYLTFAASDGEAELELAVRVNRKQANTVMDALLLAVASGGRIDIPWQLPVEITRTIDAGDGIHSMTENLTSKLGWLGICENQVTLFVSGFVHAVRIPYKLWYDKATELYECFMNQGQQWVHSEFMQDKVGPCVTERVGRRLVIRHDDLMLVGSYSASGQRHPSQPITVYQRDIDGLWLYVEGTSSARVARFVTRTKILSA